MSFSLDSLDGDALANARSSPSSSEGSASATPPEHRTHRATLSTAAVVSGAAASLEAHLARQQRADAAPKPGPEPAPGGQAANAPAAGGGSAPTTAELIRRKLQSGEVEGVVQELGRELLAACGLTRPTGEQKHPGTCALLCEYGSSEVAHVDLAVSSFARR